MRRQASKPTVKILRSALTFVNITHLIVSPSDIVGQGALFPRVGKSPSEILAGRAAVLVKVGADHLALSARSYAPESKLVHGVFQQADGAVSTDMMAIRTSNCSIIRSPMRFRHDGRAGPERACSSLFRRNIRSSDPLLPFTISILSYFGQSTASSLARPPWYRIGSRSDFARDDGITT